MPIPTKDLENLATRFWPKVNPDGPVHPVYGQCWEWTGYYTGRGSGRGAIRLNKVKIYVSRASWIIHYGYNPSLRILHKCDNSRCVNPYHLFLGTQADNVADMISKGRNNFFGDNHLADKLTDEQIIDILERSLAGESQRSLARRFGTYKTRIARIIRKSVQ